MTVDSTDRLDAATSDGDTVPPFAFDPRDPWTATFQQALEKAGLEGRRVYEVGVGSGTNIEFMLKRCGAAIVQGSDLDPRLPALAREMVGRSAPDVVERYSPVEGSVSLIDTAAARAGVARAAVVVGCLPQVPDPNDDGYRAFHLAQLGRSAPPKSRSDDHIAHYYPWSLFEEYPFNAVGFGLNEALLRRVRVCGPRAKVVLTFAGRAGRELPSDLLRANGYRPEILASRFVRQHGGTDISFFVALEDALRGSGHEDGFRCEFFADEHGQVPLSATEARDRALADPGAPIYHELMVLRGHPLDN